MVKGMQGHHTRHSFAVRDKNEYLDSTRLSGMD
jgi:hypothetical protein